MAKKPKPEPSYASALFWRRSIRANPRKVLITAVSLVGSIGVAYVQWDNFVAGTIAIVKWMTPAPIAYAQNYTNEALAAHKVEHKAQIDKIEADRRAELGSVIKVLRDTQIDQAQGKLEASKRAIHLYEFQRLKAATPEEGLKIDQAMRDEQETYKALGDQLKTLKGQ